MHCMNEPRYIKVVATICLSLGISLLVLGTRRSHAVNPDPNAKIEWIPVSDPRFAPFDPAKLHAPKPLAEEYASINDWTLLENTTFTGITCQDGRLYYTYDPKKARGKRSCPT